jgi:hypothetical protein
LLGARRSDVGGQSECGGKPWCSGCLLQAGTVSGEVRREAIIGIGRISMSTILKPKRTVRGDARVPLRGKEAAQAAL